MTITVHSLAYYPVKGCARTDAVSAEVGEMGLAHDRTFMIVDTDGTFRSQRKDPSMAVIRPEVVDGGAGLRLSAPGVESVLIDVDPEGARRPVTMFGDPLGEAADQGETAAAWFSEVLGTKSRLVRVPPDFDRDGWGETPGKVAFADAHAVLVASLASLDGLNERIGDAAKHVPIERFRPNIVLAGSDEPHVEDRIRHMAVGGVELAYATKAIRCAVTMVDQPTGRRAGPEPLRTLATYRREPEFDNGVSFGMKAAVVRSGTISVGDVVTVERWAP